MALWKPPRERAGCFDPLRPCAIACSGWLCGRRQEEFSSSCLLACGPLPLIASGSAAADIIRGYWQAVDVDSLLPSSPKQNDQDLTGPNHSAGTTGPDLILGLTAAKHPEPSLGSRPKESQQRKESRLETRVEEDEYALKSMGDFCLLANDNAPFYQIPAKINI